MSGTRSVAGAPAVDGLTCALDDYDLDQFVAVAADFGQSRLGMVVTPNVDHLVRYFESADFRDSYASADYILLDSRFLARLLKLSRGLRLPVCTGSDLTAALLERVVAPSDRIVMIGGSEPQAAQIAAQYGLTNLCHHNPPMGFIKDPAAVAACLEYIENNGPFRFCFVAVGSPQQEVVARSLKARGRARGLVLCIGASLNFVTGQESRAPQWMQRLSLEWLYRLAQDPRRLAKRYLVRGPRIFKLLRGARIVLRPRRSVASDA